MLIGGCATQAEDDPELGEVSSEVRTIGNTVGSSCSTASVRGLSKQIAEEVDCMSPDSLVRFSPTTHVTFTSNAVLPYLHPRAKTDLLAVADNHALRINSGYRTVAQQYLLYRWAQLGRCGIAIAAPPGRSNHESGRAIDLSNWSTRVGAMAAHHWAHDVPGDSVHFDNTRSPDNRGKDVRAFQRLWNRNHPGDKIAVDADYGPQTAARLKRSPAKGFKKGALCRAVERGLDVLAIDGPDKLAPGEHGHYTITIANNDEVAWSDTTRVVVADGSASPLYDASTWPAANEAGTLGIPIPGGGEDADFTLDVVAPQATEDLDVATTFALLDGDRTIGTFDLAVTIAPDADSTTSGDDGDTSEDDEGADEDGVVSSGCNAGGGEAGIVMLGFVLALVGRRRRRAPGATRRAAPCRACRRSRGPRRRRA